MPNLEAYLLEVLEYTRTQPSMRYGQILMNVLATFDKKVYVKITATNADPFYDNCRVSDFFAALQEEWHDG